MKLCKKTGIKKTVVSNAIFWGGAIIACALMGAPAFLTIILLPILALSSITAIQKNG